MIHGAKVMQTLRSNDLLKIATEIFEISVDVQPSPVTLLEIVAIKGKLCVGAKDSDSSSRHTARPPLAPLHHKSPQSPAGCSSNSYLQQPQAAGSRQQQTSLTQQPRPAASGQLQNLLHSSILVHTGTCTV
eukprot:COSAG01_NODE_1045_length_11952_cov_98.448241_7_plen_131_part_00